jgi:hypothetical protein
MRKLGLLFLLVLLAFSSLTAQATPIPTLTQHSEFYSDETMFFAALRTDDGYIETLDGVLQRASAYIPGLLPPGVGLNDVLDAFAQDAFGADYESAIGSWLGDVVSVGLTLTPENFAGEGIPSGLLTASITDREAATNFVRSFLDAQLSFAEYEVTEGDAFTTFIAPADAQRSDGPSFAIGDDVLFAGIFPSDLPLEALTNALSADEAYNNTLALLPEDDYNILAYMDLPAIQALNLANLETDMQRSGVQMGAGLTALTELATAVGPGIFAATVLDGDTLTLDGVIGAPNSDVLDDIGVPTFTPGSVDLSFAERIPADAPLVIHSSDFGPSTQATLDSLRTLSDYISDQGGIPAFLPAGALSPEEELVLAAFSLDSILATLNISFAGLTGLSLERDVLPVLDGDAATYLRTVPVNNQDFPLPILPDFGLVFQTSNENGAQALVDALFQASELYEAGYSIESYGDGGALALPIISGLLNLDFPASDLLFGSAEDFFAFGTRAAVEGTLDTDGGLAADPTFQDAQNYFLDGSQQVWYIGTEPIAVLTEQLADLLGDLPEPNPIRLVAHSTITGLVNEDLSQVSRATITLGEMPDVPVSEAAADD